MPAPSMSRRQVLRMSAVAAALPPAVGLTRRMAAAGNLPGQPAHGAAAGDISTVGQRMVEPFPLHQVALGQGIFQQKRDRILNFARNYPGSGGVLAGPDRMLYLFREQAGLPNPPGSTWPGGWDTPNHLLRGHYTGHFMTMLAQAYADTGEEIFTTKLDYLVAELGKCQDASDARRLLGHPGYLSAFGEDHYIKLEPPLFRPNQGPQAIAVWAPWYTFHKIVKGLLDAHTLAGSQQALEIAFKMGEWAHSRLSRISRPDLDRMWNIYSAGEAGGANEVMAWLAALTDDPGRKEKYLVTAKAFDFSTMRNAMIANEDILNGRHANTFVPPNTGYLRILELTGEADYLTAAQNFWDMVVPDRIYSNGGTSGPGEFFRQRGVIGAHLRTGSSTYNETCTAYNMLKLSRSLFFHDPDAKYMDYYEKCLFNQILGSKRDIDSDAGPWVTYHQNLFPGASRGLDWTRYIGVDGNGSCCTGTGLENHTQYQESIYFRSADDSTLYVNLFIASTLDWAERGFVISQTTDYPAEGSSILRVEQGSGPLDIKVRVPAWAEQGYAVRINGVAKAIDAAPGSYISLDRQWARGDTIGISVPSRFRIETAPDDRVVQSVFYGPSLMVSQGDEASLTSASNRENWRELSLYKDFSRDGDFGRAFSPTATPQQFVSHGFTFVPFHVADPGTPVRYHAYFLRSEPTIVFGSHDSDVPNRDRGDGWTFLDLVWADAPFEDHAGLQSSVEKVAAAFVAAGLLTEHESEAVSAAAARASQELGP